ncbi:Glycosyl transferase family 2 [Parapedobacter indicus]|uniref:Glycosyl transferase family 2 n=2 Tax=Parapedobacter indicus TaxID=1477437 RepID=A0A1I3PPE4_9SPHI|nr:glycosyl transferase family 2 [Parapedobacter indicus]SFJ23355.1 Glycosyl transferase family 2 [Parapedobacter indicus]
MDDWECIIVDDGSTDRTAEVAAMFTDSDRRFRYYYQTNRGISAARNTGINEASGDFIQFLDADDLISADKLSIQKAFLQNHPEVDVSYTNAFYFYGDMPKKRYRSFYFDLMGRRHVGMEEWIPQVNASGTTLLAHLAIQNIAPINCMLTRKKLIDRIKGFDESYWFMEDWDFWLRCAFEGARFAFLGEQDAYVNIRMHGDSVSTNTYKMLLQHVRRIKQTEREIKVRGINGINFSAREFREPYKAILRKLIHTAGYTNLSKQKSIIKMIGGREFLKAYLSTLNRYCKGKLPQY